MSKNSSPSVEAGLVRLPRQPLRFFFHYMLGFRGLVGRVMVLSFIGCIAIQTQVLAIGNIVDTVTSFSGDAEGYWRAALMPVGFLLLVRAIYFLSFFFVDRTLRVLTPKLRVTVKQDLFDYLQNHSAEFILNRLAGQLGHKVSQVAESCKGLFDIFMWQFYFSVIALATTIVILLRISPLFSLFFFVWVALYVALAFYVAVKTVPYSKDYADQRSHVGGRVIDAISNALSIKSFANFGYERQRLARNLEREYKSGFKFVNQIVWNLTAQRGMSSVLMVGSILLALYLQWKGQLTVGDFVMVVTYMVMASNLVFGISTNIVLLFDYVGTIDDALSVIAQPHGVVDKKRARKLKVEKGKIEFSNVSFSYKEKESVFENLDLVIPAGQKVGLVGHSGAGKTSFVSVLLRYYDLESGRILIDGQNIADVAQDSLRRNVALIPQDTALFHRTLMENIRYGNLKATDEEVFAAARKAHAHEFIERLPQTYDTIVGERGVKLSGGQRQRIAVARAILKDAPILVLDEATSALDSESEKCIQKSLKTLMKNKTVIAIAHRLSTLSYMDRILVFEDGAIVEDGTHAELLKKRNGVYAHLWKLQSGDFIGGE